MNGDKLLLVSHCILNPYSAIHGGTQHRPLATELVTEAMGRGVGIIQLPCPETTLLGARRWAQSFEQYDTPWYRDHCARLVERFVQQVADHVADGKHLVAVIGIAGSPSCAVFETTSAPYGGLVPGMPSAPPLPPSTRVPRQGHFVQILQKTLRQQSIHANLLELPRADCPADEAETFLAHVTNLLEH